MQKATGHILKNSEVKLQGQYHFDAVQQTVINPEKGKIPAMTAPQVNIIQNHQEFAVIEITCSCGTKTHIKCEYADMQSTSQETNENKIDGDNDNES